MFRFLGSASVRIVRVLLTPQGLLMLFSIALATMHPALASNVGPPTNGGPSDDPGQAGQNSADALNTLRTAWLVPIVAAIGAIGWIVAAVENLRGAEHGKMFHALTGVGGSLLVGIAGAGFIYTMALKAGGSAAGFLIH
jgi:hypothetical protein